MSTENGGPAFPELWNAGHNSDWQTDNGMTLREYFAAKAMQGLMSNADIESFDAFLKYYARLSYKMADAMIEAGKGDK